MWFVTILTLLMLAADVWWWRYVDVRAKAVGIGRGWRIAIGVYAALMAFSIALLIATRVFRIQAQVLPEKAAIIIFIWHLLSLPALVLLVTGVKLRRGVARVFRGAALPAEINVDRRVFLAKAMVIAPPVATLALAGKSMSDLDEVRIREARLGFKDLPKALDGAVIAFVSDPHVGSFLSDYKYRKIIDLTNNLDADLVLHGGDLINSSLKDLPDGIQLLQSFRSRYGMFSCQGNHDGIQSVTAFEDDTRKAGISMLLDEAPVTLVRGQKVQILSPRWQKARNDEAVTRSVERLLAHRDNDAWQIVLAHHPHAFDAAAAAGVPLTLSGHTHGGQLALSHNIGFGPLMYRYWSGEYRKGNSAAFVSNGVGNWFPLRFNVPCEIVRIELTRA